ncbi:MULTISPECIES: TonB-dependent receptor [unclassified Wenzhouxiangella]|uniref:TonB-dependent receptor n=1 Tax=unclassified Wenzhouxiangella TaxID=2613841 RepID=UPI000E326096|nr:MULTISPECIES: TonB-dependent receptor [unclassified Wenzhouxiangella]RFF26275.1 TonB-dependent receptor [Wenzhouxiangella sp. 15181]RFP67454.1 TonB-dependent receptor [Wenzhouxiangella sp. 15190]
MMNKPNTTTLNVTILALAIAAGLSLAPDTLAQEDNDQVEDERQDERNTELDDVIVVTASRREEALQDVAMAVSTIDTDERIDAGFAGLTDILTFVPGVSTTNSGRPYLNNVYMRGINAQLSAGVSSYVDDIPFGSSTVYTQPTPLDGTLLDLGTLDVMKGPQGTLYGASAMGGILKFNTRAPSLNAGSGSVSTNLSNTEGGGFNQLYRANLNGPLVQDTLGGSLTVFREDTSGYVDNVTIGEDNWDDYEYYGGSGSLLWEVTDRLEVKLQGLHQSATQDGTSLVQANYARDLPVPGFGAAEPIHGEYETGQAAINPSEYEASLGGLTVNYDLGLGELTSVTSYQEMFFKQEADVTESFASFADQFFPDTAPHSSAVLVGDLGFDKWTQELRLTSDSNESFEWIVGTFYTEEEGFNIQDLVITPDVPLYFANFPSNYEELSAFATGTWYFTPQLDASLGLRYTDYSNDVELNTVGPLLAPLPLSEIEDDVTNFLFNLRYRPAENMSFYTRVASGFRPGGANFLLLNPETGEPLSNPFFEPDDLVSYEAGVKGSSADGRFTYDLAGYYIDWQDYQIGVVRNGTQVVGNAEKAVSRGLEATLGMAVTDALTLTGSLSYVNAELAADEPDLGGADGDQLPSTPEWQAVLDANYSFRLGERPAYVGASYRYKGEMPVGFDGYTDASGTEFPPSSPRVDIDDYHLVDLRAGVALRNFDISLYVNNVFDEWAWTAFSPSFATIPTGAPTQPRTYGAMVRWHFQ